MYVAPQLEGVRGKLYRATDHFRDIDVAIGDLHKLQGDAAGHKLEPDGTLIVTLPYQPSLDPRFAWLIGDCIHNTRSALDQLVAQLAILNMAAPEAITKTAFPICLTSEQFEDATKRRVAPYICGTALTKIEELQPYSTGRKEKDILWILSQLDIIDKHRLLVVARHNFRTQSFKIKSETGWEAAHTFVPDNTWKSSENGAEVIRFQGLPPQSKVHVEVNTELAIQIEQTGLVCDGQNLLVLLANCIEYVGSIVDGFGEWFFGEPGAPAF